MKPSCTIGFHSIILALIFLTACGSLGGPGEVTTAGGITLNFPRHWSLQEEPSCRIDASLREGEIVLALYPLQTPLEVAVNGLLDARGYFWNGKADHGQICGYAFRSLGRCCISSCQYGGDRASQKDYQAHTLYCCQYQFLFQHQDTVYIAELVAYIDAVDEGEAKGYFEGLLAPGFEVLETLSVD